MIKLGPGARDFGAACLEAGQQVRGHVVAPTVGARAGQSPCLVKVDAERAERDEHPQAAQVRL
ncbi:MAG: hypothetical protein WCI61_08795, partial [Chloroflexota bacterium]